MAKETMIVFVYDTECLKDELEDPVSAVLYFHPSWVSDTQKVALCGQLMGTSYFLRDCFFRPKIITLQNGKFVLKEFGRFLLAVGTDRNISDHLLEYRANLLSALIKFYHRDLQAIYDQFAPVSQHKNLSEKLYQIFETYLPILQCNGNIFHNVPKLRMPKTANAIFLEAIQTLQCCQQTKGILGGAILYHNKVVASQLDTDITKQLVLTDPLHIRTTAEAILSTEFHIPNGVLMLVAYIEQKEYRKLQSDAQRAQSLLLTNLAQGSLPFQYAKRKMKRDKSLIFTHIPEENDAQHPASGQADELSFTEPPKPMTRPKSLLIRPTHLPLRHKTSAGLTKELPESGIASINFDETDSYPEFIGRTSVCSTPMAENKILNVGTIMSICSHPDDIKTSKHEPKETENDQVKTNRAVTMKQKSVRLDIEKFMQSLLSHKMERRNSFTDIQDSIKKLSKKWSLKQISNGFGRHNANTKSLDHGSTRNSAEVTTDFIENDVAEEEEKSDASSDSSEQLSKIATTLTDPSNPILNANGQPMSRSLFEEFLEKYYRLSGSIEQAEDNKDSEIAELLNEFKEFDEELKKLDKCLQEQLREQERNRREQTENLVPKEDSEEREELKKPASRSATTPSTLDKKALSLPLKPLTINAMSQENSSQKLPMTSRKASGGVPLTPLMAKLSVLAASEANNTWDFTPGFDLQTPLNTHKSFSRKSSLKCDDALEALIALDGQKAVTSSSTANSSLERIEVYLCGQQNMTLILLMEEGSAFQEPIVKKMFDICVSRFPHMEASLNKTLNVNVEGDKRDGDYSFICLDAKWDALQRKGPWNPVELNTLEYIHRDFNGSKNLTDLILRSHDSVFYGYNRGRTEFFYKEPVHQVAGLPPPSDPMGNVTIRAKARLERDHFYNLF